MSTAATEALLAAALPLLVAVVVLLAFRRRRRDEVFRDVTPGEVPSVLDTSRTSRVRGREWSETTAVRFTPPDDLAPGLSGTVIDGRVDDQDLTATLVDLAIRRHLDISPEGDDWRITRTVGPETDSLAPHEKAVVKAFLDGADSVRVGELKSADFAFRLQAAQVTFYREVVDGGLYLRHPRSRNNTLAALGVVVLLVGLGIGIVELVKWRHGAGVPWVASIALSLSVGAGLLVWLGRGRTPRTALGTAKMIQSRGFREYLATAEAGQIRFEEAAHVFSRYLAYAVAYGVAQHWASVVGEAALSARLREAGLVVLENLDQAFSPDLIDLYADLGNLVDLTPDGALDVFGLTDIDLPDLPSLDVVADAFSGLGDALSSFGDAIGSVADLGGCLDGCDGCGLDF